MEKKKKKKKKRRKRGSTAVIDTTAASAEEGGKIGQKVTQQTVPYAQLAGDDGLEKEKKKTIKAERQR